MDALERYWQARMKADRQDLFARLLHKDDDLLPYEAITQVLQARQQIPHSAPRIVPLDKIVGSVGRYRDFTREFMPREGVGKQRWIQVDMALNRQEGLPPIDLYQIGDVYFVSDGNHRVSVARANGLKEIEAYVTEVDVEVDLQPGDSLDEAIIKAECVHFLNETGLGRRCGDLAIGFTRPGGFTQLLEHIRVHRHFMHIDHPDMWQITFEDASEDWYQEVYLPVVSAIRRQQLTGRFHDCSEADLYITISGRLFEAREKSGEEVNPEEAVAIFALEAQETRPTLFRAMLNLIDRFASLAGQTAVPVGVGAEWVAPPLMPGTTDLSNE
jgi:hypothetical protein